MPAARRRPRLNGKPMGLRYAWLDPSKLLRAASSGRVRLTVPAACPP
jgi:hypothetical protein